MATRRSINRRAASDQEGGEDNLPLRGNVSDGAARPPLAFWVALVVLLVLAGLFLLAGPAFGPLL